mmetsp:Transcript_1986/g.4934  ORF Transcript_1986/g.4934 Transcript_1986/m.4934 type:complete len:233 (-) Transcript_1986:8-706(-)
MYLGEPPSSPSVFLAMCVAMSGICCARPKSQIFAFCCASRRMFMDFRSRCTTRWPWRKLRPSAICDAINQRCGCDSDGSRRAPKSRSCREPPDMNSVTTSSVGGCRQAPMKRTRRGCRNRRRALISFFISSKCARPPIFLMATSWPFQEPRNTCAEPPAPSCGPKTSCSGRMSSFQPMLKASLPVPERTGDLSREPAAPPPRGKDASLEPPGLGLEPPRGSNWPPAPPPPPP